MDITPSPDFMEAVRQVLGIDDLIPGPEIVIPAMRDETVASKIRAAHAAIVESRVSPLPSADGA